MLEDLIAFHHEVMRFIPNEPQRYLYEKMNLNTQSLCIMGNRGVGKTTLMCQILRNRYPDAADGLYLSADNIHVLSLGLLNIAQTYFSLGGKALFIDEIHKYPNWAQEIKNIIDIYKNKQIFFSASSPINLNRSKYDLSRRVVYHELKGLSFREHLKFRGIIDLPVLTLDILLRDHARIAATLHADHPDVPLLKYFREYIQQGYFPFFLEGLDDYFQKILNIIEKVLFEDLAVVYELKQTTLPVLKKLLWLIATTNGLTPNIDRIAKTLCVSREVIYNCLEYLAQSGLLRNLYAEGGGLKLSRKPGKIYFENTNLLYALNRSLNAPLSHHLPGDLVGHLRETFFINQLSNEHHVSLHDKTDYCVNGNVIIEVGGKTKTQRQIAGEKNAYLAVDDTLIGMGNRIPLFLFGMLY